MASKTLIDGTAYNIVGGSTLIDGTGYTIAAGTTMVDGTSYSVPLATKESGGSGLEPILMDKPARDTAYSNIYLYDKDKTTNTAVLWPINGITVTSETTVTTPRTHVFDLSPYIDETSRFLFITGIDLGSTTGAASYYTAIYTYGLFADSLGRSLFTAPNSSTYKSSSSASPSIIKDTMFSDATLEGVANVNNGGGTQCNVTYTDRKIIFAKSSGSATQNRAPTSNIGQLIIIG